MKKIIKVTSLILTVAVFVVGFSVLAMPLKADNSKMVRKIVVFQDDVDEAIQSNLLKHFVAADLGELKLINGRTVLLPEKAVNALSKKAEIKRIDDDVEVFALGKPTNPGKKPKEEKPQPDQTTPWGVDRIDADLVWETNTGQGVKVGIIDSGIDKDHLDLKDNIKGGINIINPKKSWDDDCGHGTHVAGTVAALNNNIGVVGVAPQAHLHAIKVLNRRGSGYISDVIKGLQWSIDNEMQVVNMSLGTSSNIQSYHDAIIAAYNNGITIVAAAGNDGETDGKIYYPAKYPETIAVSATNDNDGLAYFSSYGEEIDLAAPGRNVNSTWNDGYYHFGNGTSMATPHVVGVAALVIASGVDDTNENGRINDEVREILQNTAEDLGNQGKNIYFGSGLVDAENAVK